MPFITQGNTNWKFIGIVVVLAIIAGGGILTYLWTAETTKDSPVTESVIEEPIIEKPPEESLFGELFIKEEDEQFIKSWHEVNIDISSCDPIYGSRYTRDTDYFIDSENSIFISPQGGEIYTTEDELIIKWDSSKIDVSTIQLYSIDNDYNNCLGIPSLGGIYGRTDLSDPVSKEGVFIYKLSSRYLYPADYGVVLSNWGYSRNIVSNPFEIQAAKEVRAPIAGKLTMEFIKSLPDSLSKNDHFSIKIRSKDSTGRILNPDDGFYSRSQIYKRSSTDFVKSFDGAYSSEDGTWTIDGQLDIPEGDYEMRVSIWCSHTKKPCQERYISGSNNSVRQKIYFTIK